MHVIDKYSGMLDRGLCLQGVRTSRMFDDELRALKKPENHATGSSAEDDREYHVFQTIIPEYEILHGSRAI